MCSVIEGLCGVPACGCIVTQSRTSSNSAISNMTLNPHLLSHILPSTPIAPGFPANYSLRLGPNSMS